MKTFVQLLYKRRDEAQCRFHKAFPDFSNKNEDFESIFILNLPQWRRSGVFIVNLEHISHLTLVLLLLTLNM